MVLPHVIDGKKVECKLAVPKDPILEKKKLEKKRKKKIIKREKALAVHSQKESTTSLHSAKQFKNVNRSSTLENDSFVQQAKMMPECITL